MQLRIFKLHIKGSIFTIDMSIKVYFRTVKQYKRLLKGKERDKSPMTLNYTHGFSSFSETFVI